MFKKQPFVLFLTCLILGCLIIAGCGDAPESGDPAVEPVEPAETQEDVDEEVTLEETLFTMDEIAQFDGNEGRPAYIVVDGTVYDVTNVGPWRSGTHYGFQAGKDVTEALKNAAPHGANLLNQAEIVGRIAD
jgi:predicted heme/steroid binding protein